MLNRVTVAATALFCVGPLLTDASALHAFGQPYLVKDGRAEAEIVLGEKPGRVAKLAARELQSHVEKITGATLPIVSQPTGKQAVAIHIGNAACSGRVNQGSDGLAHGAFCVVSGPNWLALWGTDWEFTPIEPRPRKRGDNPRVLKEWDKITGDTFGHPHWRLYDHYNEAFGIWDFDDFGTINAVHEFLRGLGVRWYFPGDLGTVMPKLATIPLAKMNRTVKPDFAMRCLVLHGANRTPEAFLWRTRLGVNYPYDLLGATQVCHGSKFVTMRQEMKEAHPEIYALYAGKRATEHKDGVGAPCLSSPLFLEKHLKFARAMFDHYREPMLSLDVCDGYGICQCEQCKGKARLERGWDGALSDQVWGHVNRVAQELYKTHPTRKVSGLSYGGYRQPPEHIGPLCPNLTLAFCQHRSLFHEREVREQFVARRNAWLKILPSKSLYTFDFHLMSMPGSAQAGVPVYFPRLIAEDLRSLKGVAMGDFLEVYNSSAPEKVSWNALAVEHLNSYVTSRLWWDADQDLDALLDEYYTNLYGPARTEMKAYVEYCAGNWMKMLQEVETINRSRSLLAKARAAAGDTIYGRRIDLVVAYTKRLDELHQRMTSPREDVPSTRSLPRKISDLKLDGQLDDKFWASTRAPVLREVQTGAKPRLKTSCHIAWGSDNALYLGIRCEEPDTKNLALGTQANDDPGIWNGDFIDVLIETQNHSYYQVTFNPAGAIMDLDRGNDKKEFRWSSGAQVAVHVGDGFWSAEVRLPCSAEIPEDVDPLSGIAGRPPSSTYPWHINVCRQRVRGNEVQLSAWSPTGKPRFGDPRKFGMIYIK